MRRRLRRASGGAGREVSGAIVLVATSSRGRVVAACCGRAGSGGVRTGMTVAHAGALLPCGGVVLLDHDPIGDARALVRLAMWAERFSPVVAIDPPDGLLLDVTGCARVFGGERRLLLRAIGQCERLGLRVSGAIAPTFGSAWAFARFSERPAVLARREELAVALAGLPLEALRICASTVEAMAEIGIATVGDLMAQPRSALPARFGAEVLLRLDQATGAAIETVSPVRAERPACAEVVFDGATTRVEAIEAAVRGLLDELGAMLGERESGARAVVVELVRVDCVPVVIEACFSRPCRDAVHLWSVLRPRVERAHLGYGVERISVRALRVGRLGHRQAERWRETDERAKRGGEGRDRGVLIDLLSNRLGHERVMRAGLAATHVPERLATHRSAMLEDHEIGEPPAPGIARPSLLLESPEPAQAIALCPDRPPSRLSWRGREIAIDAGVGPERIGAAWWRETGSGPGGCSERDYYRVRDASGVWLWVYRERATGRWFVHGVWA